MQGELDLLSPEEKIAALEKRIKEIEERLWCKECELPYGGVLSDRDLIRLIKSGRISIAPSPDLDIESEDSDLGTCKVDLHLGRQAMFIDPTQVRSLDLTQPAPDVYYHRANLQKNSEIVIPANTVIIVGTLETLELPDCIIGFLVGKSSLARRGLKVEGAPIFDAGWKSGPPVLELQNTSGVPVVAHFGQAICAMFFMHLSSPTLKGYTERARSTYRSQDGAKL